MCALGACRAARGRRRAAERQPSHPQRRRRHPPSLTAASSALRLTTIPTIAVASAIAALPPRYAIAACTADIGNQTEADRSPVATVTRREDMLLPR